MRGGGEAVPVCEMRRRLPALLLLCCCSLAVVRPSRALFDLPGAYVSQLRGGGDGEEKVPMTVVVPDYSPRPAPFGAPAPTPTTAPAPAPLPGSDDGDDMPTLPSERRGTPGREPSGGNAGAPAPAASSSGGTNTSTSTAFISSSPAVPLPAGVTDSATVLPMPTPGQEQQVVGMGTLLRARTVQLAVPLAMMLFFGALCW